jgi:DCN1-like protein 1/2
VDYFFQNGGSFSSTPATTVNTQSISALFDKYKGGMPCHFYLCEPILTQILSSTLDDEEDLILVEGTEKLCEDLEVDPTDIVTLVLAWYLKCNKMCEFTRPGWIEGWTKLGYAVD